MSSIALGAAAALLVVVLVAAQRRRALRDARDRVSIFDDVVAAWPDARLDGRDATHPSLIATVDGRCVELRVIVDSLTLRKLPVLWLEVVVRRRLPIGAALNVLRRPLGTEFFSPDRTLHHELAPRAGWPRPLRVSTSDPHRAPSPDVLEPASALLAAPRLKEIGLGPRGVRAVWLLAECEQSSYRLGRRAVFGPARVAADDVRELLAVLTAVGDRAERAREPERSAR